MNKKINIKYWDFHNTHDNLLDIYKTVDYNRMQNF